MKRKPIHRRPIQLNSNTIAVIQLFHKDSENFFDDMWMTDSDNYMIDSIQMHKKAAKQFISQLKGHWTPHFMESLMVEIDKELRKHWKQFSKKRLKEYEEKYPSTKNENE